LWTHLSWLGADALKGRAMGTPGAELTAQYLSTFLKRHGLQPLGDDGLFRQRFPMHASRPLDGCDLSLWSPGERTRLQRGSDYLLYTMGSKTRVAQPVPLVFVGYGIFAPEYDYNDYQDVSVRGAIVVFLSGEPHSESDAYFAGDIDTPHAHPSSKHRLALARGARGTIMIPRYQDHGDRSWEAWQRMFAFEHVTMPLAEPRSLHIVLNPAHAARLFEGAEHTWGGVLEMDTWGRIESFPLAVRASFSGRFRDRDFIASNVLGMLPGNDPLLRDSYVLVTAHYDHLGVGPAVRGDSIYNGVVDNAIGCAAVLEMVRVLCAAQTPLRRSIIFLFTAGEEKGLLGARYYCAHPARPLSRTIADLNIDGLAILDRFREIVGVGAEWSTLGDHLDRVAQRAGLTVGSIPAVFGASRAFLLSDQYAFAEAGVPSMLVMEGLAYENFDDEEGRRAFIRWGRERYHSPFDDLQQPLSRDAAAQHLELLVDLVVDLANTFEAPQWKPGAPYAAARLRSLARERGR
jgi:hypothetical protein